MQWIAPGIAFVRFNSFLGTEEALAATRQFVNDYAAAKTVIFDVRTHRGGGLDEMDILFPALFAEPTRLITMDTRAAVIARDGDPLANRATIKTVPSSPDVLRQEHWAVPANVAGPLAAAKVYVLTSGASASAAEHFALALKHTGRATLIGETTAGAGHFGEIMPLVNGFAAFIPLGRSNAPDSGEDWEGNGVAPHIAVAPERALVEALTRAGVAVEEAERLSAELAPQSPMRRRLPSAQ